MLQSFDGYTSLLLSNQLLIQRQCMGLQGRLKLPRNQTPAWFTLNTKDGGKALLIV
jgi:hypothetical protein